MYPRNFFGRNAAEFLFLSDITWTDVYWKEVFFEARMEAKRFIDDNFEHVGL